MKSTNIKRLKKIALKSDAWLKQCWYNDIEILLRGKETLEKKLEGIIEAAFHKRLLSRKIEDYYCNYVVHSMVPSVWRYFPREFSENSFPEFWKVYRDEFEPLLWQHEIYEDELRDKLKAFEMHFGVYFTGEYSQDGTPILKPTPPVMLITDSEIIGLRCISTEYLYKPPPAYEQDTPIIPKEQYKNLQLGHLLDELKDTFYLNFQINLTYDKKDILAEVDKAISKVKRHHELKNAKHKQMTDIISNLFFRYYLGENCTKEEALEKTSRGLLAWNIKLDAGSIERKYYPSVKKRTGKGDIRKLKKDYFENKRKQEL